jgi:pseudouridylate synthase
MRLQRFLARAGVASRRGSEQLMRTGRVRVNDRVTSELGSKIDVDHDVVTVDGRPCHLSDTHRYLMLYKPAGYVTTMSDPQGRPCVASLVPVDRNPGLYPVGRLDADATGLLLFTTNGDLGNRLLHPSGHVWKHYLTLIRGMLSTAELRRIETGIRMGDDVARPAKVELLAQGDKRTRAVSPRGVPQGMSVVGLTIHEGKKHQVKRMLEAAGHEVVRLHRDEFGPLRLTGLASGQARELTDEERRAVEALAGDMTTKAGRKGTSHGR